MDGKEIAGLSIASVSMLTGIIFWWKKSGGDENYRNYTLYIILFLFWSILTFILFMTVNSNDKPDIILHISLMPIYLLTIPAIVSLFIIIGAVIHR